MIYPIITIHLLLSVKLIYDVTLWRRKEIKGISTKTVNHKKEWTILGIACIAPIYFLAKYMLWPWYYGMCVTGPLTAFYLWILFDGLYNILRGFWWFFTGSVDDDDASTDEFLRKQPLWLQVAIKWVPLAALLYLFISNLKA